LERQRCRKSEGRNKLSRGVYKVCIMVGIRLEFVEIHVLYSKLHIYPITIQQTEPNSSLNPNLHVCNFTIYQPIKYGIDRPKRKTTQSKKKRIIICPITHNICYSLILQIYDNTDKLSQAERCLTVG
jgi:hypothetical protein